MSELQCVLCAFNTGSLKAFVDHYKVHVNVANFEFPCGMHNCCRRFRKYASFKSHMYRDHRGQHNSSHQSHDEVNLLCQISFCEFSCNNLQEFMGHLKGHIAENVQIQCPFKSCVKTFSVKSSFTSHISRCHHGKNIDALCDNIVKLPVAENESEEQFSSSNYAHNGEAVFNDFVDDTIDLSLGDEVVTDESQFMQSLALFYLKLQAKFLLPATVIQNIVEEMQTVHNFGLSVSLKKLHDRLLELNVGESDIKDLLNDLHHNNPFNACASGVLRTHQTRQTFFKTNFKYVAPKQVYLGESKQNVSCFAQYVPIKESLQTLFEDTSVKAAYNQTSLNMPVEKSNDSGTSKCVLSDITDGQAFLSNSFFVQNPGALRIILYQDAFEVANPLGSGKKKHKILAVYFSLANFPPYCRSTVDQIQLVMLCRETDFKQFGQHIVFRELINDLQSMEDTGLQLFEETRVFAAVLAIVGDNLGSHCIGGFSENFSSNNYVCRYCTIDRQTVNETPHTICNIRTPSHYDEIVSNLETDPDADSFGIKFRSVFNNLRNYHVCNPGLPPCLGHDLFEGVVSRDVALIIKHFVKKDKYFSYEQLNRLIARFKFMGSDAENKPCELKINADKIGGHAVQNWCFVRLLPLLIGDRIIDKENPFWIQLLLLREIVDLICAPRISLGQVALLRVLIVDYLSERISLFPGQSTTPKHHFLAHYPGLILQFGPLIRVWTLRFESKHSYFKNCVRKLRNFKNVCSTLAERHQLLQAYLSEGLFFPPLLSADGTFEFNAKMYSADVEQAVSHLHLKANDTVVASKVRYKGTLYKPGMFVVAGEIDDGLLLGRVVLILVHHGNTVYFVVEKCRAIRCLEMGSLCLEEIDGDIECLECDKLLDYYPLAHYKKDSFTHIVLHHAVFSD